MCVRVCGDARKVAGKTPRERKKKTTVKRRENERTSQTTQTTQSSCALALDPSLVHHLRAEKQSCASETCESARQKQWAGETKTRSWRRRRKRRVLIVNGKQPPRRLSQEENYIQWRFDHRQNLKSQRSWVPVTTKQWAHFLSVSLRWMNGIESQKKLDTKMWTKRRGKWNQGFQGHSRSLFKAAVFLEKQHLLPTAQWSR